MKRQPKKKVLTLYVTKEDEEEWAKEKNDDSESSETEEIKTQPVAMLQKIVGNDTKIETPGTLSKIFTYEECDVLVIMDKYKKSYAESTHRNEASLKLDGKTKFISNPGVFQLVSRSKTHGYNRTHKKFL